MINEIPERFEVLFQLKKEIPPLEKELAEKKHAYHKLKMELINYLEENGVKSIKDLQGRLAKILPIATHASIKKENKDAAFEWLKNNGYAYAVQPNVHHGTLSKIIKERLEFGNPFPEELFGYYLEKNIALSV